MVTVVAAILWVAWLIVAVFALASGVVPGWWTSLADRAFAEFTVILAFAYTGARMPELAD